MGRPDESDSNPPSRRSDQVVQRFWLYTEGENADLIGSGLELLKLIDRIEEQTSDLLVVEKLGSLRQRLTRDVVDAYRAAVEDSPPVLIEGKPYPAITSRHSFCDLKKNVDDLPDELCVPLSLLFGDRRLTGVALQVWGALRLAAIEEDQGTARGAVSQSWLAERLQVSKASIEKAVARLKDEGLLSLEPGLYGWMQPQAYEIRLRA